MTYERNSLDCIRSGNWQRGVSDVSGLGSTASVAQRFDVRCE